MATTFSVIYRPSTNPSNLDPNLHIVRELLIIDQDGILIVNDPAVLVITAGEEGRYAKVHTASTMEFG